MDSVLTLTAGENRPLPSTAVTVSVRSASPVNTSAILLTDAGRVRSDADLVFYNQPSGPGVGYRSAGSADIISVDTAALPREIATVVVAASLDARSSASAAMASASASRSRPAARSRRRARSVVRTARLLSDLTMTRIVGWRA